MWRRDSSFRRIGPPRNDATVAIGRGNPLFWPANCKSCCILLASRSGAGGVQLDARNEAKPSDLSATGRRQFAHALAEIGLQLASLDFPLRRPLWDPERLNARIEALKQAMEFAYELKARVVTVRLGGLPGEIR